MVELINKTKNIKLTTRRIQKPTHRRTLQQSMLAIMQCIQHALHILRLHIVRLEWKVNRDVVDCEGWGAGVSCVGAPAPTAWCCCIGCGACCGSFAGGGGVHFWGFALLAGCVLRDSWWLLALLSAAAVSLPRSVGHAWKMKKPVPGTLIKGVKEHMYYIQKMEPKTPATGL
jgi:hypothetical protein